MTNRSLAQPTRPPTTEDARHTRGVALATNFFHEIRKVSDAKGLYSVPASRPAASARGEAYLVQVWPVAQCSCPDFNHRVREAAPCKHIHAVRHLVKKSQACDGCGVRCWNPELAEVQDYHGSLSYFEGDMLCTACFSGSDCW